ncbi:OmpA family protein [Shimia abyssi]|uniref:OOP family OmpA-OmpF porin n=1 Tax=Shimia abyssi TaxID=1662395 RepID=A0A2P8FHL8_9RHOB|nr:OmpA family protein [Shimia abyssi]PSL21244.1 OOP family OmpA-OmpF porin [Shimia abyssi]
MIRALGISLALWPGVVSAFDPALPDSAQLIGQFDTAAGYYTLPVGVFVNGAVPSERYGGGVRRRSWRIGSGFTGTADVMADLTAQLLRTGYEIRLSCDAQLCGGFDFRFNTEVMPPPEMFVDLADFRFLAGSREADAGPEAIGILVSRTAQAGMVQIIEVAPQLMIDSVRVVAESTAPVLEEAPHVGVPVQADDGRDLRPAVVEASDISLVLERTGHIVLSDLVFETGSSQLGEGPFGSLAALATYLNDDAERRVALVGHTDSEGSLQNNTELSRRRATSVRTRLVEVHGVGESQLEARGVGFLSPIASNLTEAGRNANRRVEAVLLNTK